MPTLFVRHTVADYAAWRKVYDSVAPFQKAHGVTAEAVYQATDNPNDVTVVHDFDSAALAQDFLKLDELKTILQKAGVVGEPTVWITQKV